MGSAAPDAVSWELASCPFEYDGRRDIDCGTLTVYETPGLSSRLIHVAVAVLRAPSSDRVADPFVIIGGGPGGEVLAALPNLLNLDPELAARDVVFFDPRGSGYSSPRLDCAEFAELALLTADKDLSADETRAASSDAARRCRARLAMEVDPAAYSSVAVADDLEQLRIELGYPAWNVYGVSYGSRMALEYARRHPASTRTIVLDGVVPPDVDLIAATSFWDAFDRLATTCAADQACHRLHGDISATLQDLISWLERDPLEFTVTVDGRDTAVSFDEGDLMSAVIHSLYNRAEFVGLPAELDVLDAGRTELAQREAYYQLATPSFVAEGESLSVYCSEFVVDPDVEAIRDNTAGLDGRIADVIVAAAESTIAQCEAWAVPPAPPASRRAVTSNLPALLLSGEFDPVTPPSYADHAAATLPGSTAVVLPAIGHGALFAAGRCPWLIVQQFLDHPEEVPDTSCTDDMPALRFH